MTTYNRGAAPDSIATDPLTGDASHRVVPVLAVDIAGSPLAETNGLPLSQLLSSDGTGGLMNSLITGDYSVTPDTFYYTVPAGKRATICGFTVVVADTIVGWNLGGYGALSMLTNGLTVGFYDADDVLIADLPTINIAHQWKILGETEMTIDTGATEKIVTMTIRLARPVTLLGSQYVQVLANDDLSGLIAHLVAVWGSVADE